MNYGAMERCWSEGENEYKSAVLEAFLWAGTILCFAFFLCVLERGEEKRKAKLRIMKEMSTKTTTASEYQMDFFIIDIKMNDGLIFMLFLTPPPLLHAGFDMPQHSVRGGRGKVNNELAQRFSFPFPLLS